MLQFVFGRAASGKSYETVRLIKEAVNIGKEPVLIVPEQFSFESEKAVLEAVGDGMAQRVSVLSFTRLCDEVERVSGGTAQRLMTDSDRNILMSIALKNCADTLSVFKRYSASSGFVSKMLDIVGEFKQAAVSPSELLNASEMLTDRAIGDKLCDIALIYTEYENLVAERFVDPFSRLDKVYDRLGNYNFFEGKTVFIDSFIGFTGQQYKIIDRIISQCENLTVSFCYDTESENVGIFENIRFAKDRILRMAKSHSVKCGEDIVLKQNHYESEDISALEKLLAFGDISYNKKCENITVCHAATVYDEAEFAARTVRKTVREKGVRYADFTIVARNAEVYEQPLKTACERNGVNCFIDRRMQFLSMPPAVIALSAMEAVIKPSTENILRFHKSGISLMSIDEISELENYTYLWNIDGNGFKNEWDMNPNGFKSSEKIDEKELLHINELRLKAIKPLEKFKFEFKGSAEDRAKALYNLFVYCSAEKAFKELENEYISSGNDTLAELLRRSYKELMSLLESLFLCMGKSDITSSEFYKAFKNAASLVTVGLIPQTLDEVTFGAADRIRPSRPKYIIVLGMAQGVFPAGLPKGGILCASERAVLSDMGIELSDCSAKSAIDEELLVYSILCCATRGVFISYPDNYDGSASSPSATLTNITEKLDVKRCTEPSAVDESTLPETVESAFSQVCRRLPYDAQGTAPLVSALCKDEKTRQRIEAVVSQSKPPEYRISPDTAKKLFGDNIRLSPSKFENFNRCRFMFFCKHGLNINRIQPAAFDVMQRGTIVHYVLQRVIETYGKSVSQLDEKQIYGVVEQFTDEYLDSVMGYRSIETDYMRFLVSTVKRALRYIVLRLALEFANSQFEPVRCELGIGAKDGIPAIEIPVDEDTKMTLTGIVDRLDKWNGYVRIIDYKTGSRDFKLPDIVFGQNMQMLIYLYAVCRDEKFGGKPAGILYSPAKRNLKGDKSVSRMNGIIADDDDVVEAMESGNVGNFIPVHNKRNASSFILQEDFEKIFSYIDRRLESTGKQILSGNFAAFPIDGLKNNACEYCDFWAICRMKNEKHRCVPKMSNDEAISLIESGGNGDEV